MFKYRKAFLRNDGERYNAFLEAVSSGEKQLHADNLAPYEIVRSALDANRWGFNARLTDGEKTALNASWASLPDFCDNKCRGGHMRIDRCTNFSAIRVACCFPSVCYK